MLLVGDRKCQVGGVGEGKEDSKFDRRTARPLSSFGGSTNALCRLDFWTFGSLVLFVSDGRVLTQHRLIHNSANNIIGGVLLTVFPVPIYAMHSLIGRISYAVSPDRDEIIL